MPDFDADIVIVGGGASGMTAAIAAARLGVSVLIVERMQRVGKKLLATGNGRCNITQTECPLSCYHGALPDFVDAVFHQFGLRDTLDFFERLGVLTAPEAGGKIFPITGQASSVLDVLRHEMERLGVRIVTDARVQSISAIRGGFESQCTNDDVFRSRRVILAAGGQAAPNLGSNGTGFKIARQLGHAIVEPFPALVQICLDAPYLKHLAGLKLNGVASVWEGERCLRTEAGELLFAEYGISGPPILQLSRCVSEREGRTPDPELRLDLFPEWTKEALQQQIAGRIACAPDKTKEFVLVGLIHKRLILTLLRQAGVEEHQQSCGDLRERDIAAIAAQLKDWRVRCTGTKSWMDAQVTAGGVDTREVDGATLESKRVPGVHFCGEILDVDGDCGGYNLQWAWSSGHVAGVRAAASIKMSKTPPHA